jgi:thioredoxin-dependent peroxiredoxin
VTFPILSDAGRDVARAYGVLNDSGEYARRWTFYIGKDGKILAIDREVHPRTAGEDITAHLSSLGVDRAGK